jgi:trimeric autotransporter adhesin
MKSSKKNRMSSSSCQKKLGITLLCGLLGISGAITPYEPLLAEISGTVSGGTYVVGPEKVVKNGDTITLSSATISGVTFTGDMTIGNLTATDTQVNGPLDVTGQTTTNGITNTGNIATTTLGTTGNANVGGALTTHGITNTGPLSSADGNASLSVANGGTSLGVTNAGGQLNGITSNTGQTRIAGGDSGQSTVTLDNTGVHMANNGAPSRVTGVANGVNDNDAVNMNQLNTLSKKAYSGIAQVGALASIPEPKSGQCYSIGMGVGAYGGQGAVAFGGKAYVNDNITVGAGLGISSGSPSAMAAGASFSW